MNGMRHEDDVIDALPLQRGARWRWAAAMVNDQASCLHNDGEVIGSASATVDMSMYTDEYRTCRYM